jgi:hypothetical protein
LKKLTDIKTKLMASIAIVLLIASTFTIMVPMYVEAQRTLPEGSTATNVQEGGGIPLPSGVTPDLELDSSAYLNFRPNPVGVGQTILVNMWVNPPLHASRYHKDLTVTITKPDGSQDVIKVDTYRGDSTGWFEYQCNQAGTWKLKFDFLGSYFPVGNYSAYRGTYTLGETRPPIYYSFTESCYYKPASSPELELTVQEEQVLSWPAADLPTGYWTRPVEYQNREWAQILGNFPPTNPGGGPQWPADTNTYYTTDYDFLPYTQAPNAAHIVWKRQDRISGIIDGYWGTYSLETLAGNPLIIYGGRAYQMLVKPFNGETQGVWQCYDIRTGEVYWERTGVTQPPTVIEYDQGYSEVPGAEPAGFIAAVYLMYIGNGMVIKYDPMTGALLENYSIAPLTSATYYKNQYALSVQNMGGGNYRLINWTTQSLVGRTGPLTIEERVMNNISWPWSNLGSSQDFETGVAVSTNTITRPATGAWYGTTISAVSMKTGIELWNKELKETMYSSSCTVADHGKVALLTMEGYFEAYDLENGNLAWKGDTMDYPYDATGFGAYAVASAYGMIYRQAYTGVYAFDWTDGKKVWKYEALTPYQYETPYIDSEGNGVYSWDPFSTCGIIADGKMYVQNCEHTPTEPITRGWGLHCINATTGEGIWNIPGLWADYLTRDRTVSGLLSLLPGPISDGYLCAACADGYMYVIGRGKSTTTVSAPGTEVPLGSTVMVTGTVLDQSPAQPGTPCVSKESMATQMAYLHTQYPIDGIRHNMTITGVPVSLTAVNSDGAWIDLGKTTTDGYYGTFGLEWTPPDEGTYEIIASFEGDDSYGSSGASTFITVGPAPAAEVTPEPSSEEPVTHPMFSTEALIVIGVIAIAAVVIIAYLIMRRPKQ